MICTSVGRVIDTGEGEELADRLFDASARRMQLQTINCPRSSRYSMSSFARMRAGVRSSLGDLRRDTENRATEMTGKVTDLARSRRRNREYFHMVGAKQPGELAASVSRTWVKAGFSLCRRSRELFRLQEELAVAAWRIRTAWSAS